VSAGRRLLPRRGASGHGADVGDVFHRDGAKLHPGPDPERRSYLSYASFNDPDGNGWLLQEVTTRGPGRTTSVLAAYGCAAPRPTRTGQRTRNTWPTNRPGRTQRHEASIEVCVRDHLHGGQPHNPQRHHIAMVVYGIVALLLHTLLTWLSVHLNRLDLENRQRLDEARRAQTVQMPATGTAPTASTASDPAPST
jgi:hypothetical protein